MYRKQLYLRSACSVAGIGGGGAFDKMHTCVVGFCPRHPVETSKRSSSMKKKLWLITVSSLMMVGFMTANPLKADAATFKQCVASNSPINGCCIVLRQPNVPKNIFKDILLRRHDCLGLSGGHATTTAQVLPKPPPPPPPPPPPKDDCTKDHHHEHHHDHEHESGDGHEHDGGHKHEHKGGDGPPKGGDGPSKGGDGGKGQDS